jgi:hypothetical protein
MSGHQAERTWQSDLIAPHPALFQIEAQRLNRGTRLSGRGRRWRDLVERATHRITDAVKPASRGSIPIVQIKEKFATIRINTDRRNALPEPPRRSERAAESPHEDWVVNVTSAI